MTAQDLPAEILTYIFELAVEDESLFEHMHATVMTESAWGRKTPTSDWLLMDPTKVAHAKQIRKYTITKAIMFTCRRWYKTAYHLLFECLFVSDPSRLPGVCTVLDRYAWLGWYVRRIHLHRYYATRRFTMSDLENMLVSVIHQCPNLELFTVEWAITPSFPAIADALTTYSTKSLRSIYWTLAPESLPRLIWALDSLPGLVSAEIHLESKHGLSGEAEDEASILLGAAAEVAIALPALKQLTLWGHSQDFIEQATGWSLPALQSFTLDFAANRNDLPDVVPFLAQHGTQLLYLDLNTIPAIDIAAVLAACPLLKTFAFNPDWRLQFHVESADPAASPTLLSSPHPNITHIGLHQLLHAFLPSRGSEITAALPTAATYLLQRINDLTFGQLTKRLFPQLQVIRVLNRTLLTGLEKNNGPEDEGMDRWKRWVAQCDAEGIRLEDCTGAHLGDLPMDEDEESDEEEDEEDETRLRPSNVKELRSLIEEIRQMLAVEEPQSEILTDALKSHTYT
ncbi:hypothetical protein FA95DRAFT_1496544 [Auriscalpium vulgare]|uniref:Uncharacterized protein n=1 Tax=Auriscalpium vulgare TaxID=40419 RepID=A0ACB8RLW4_9AGAM|nr:hypothetical protein FA95DRAFT_1496544 [Auriscalpium vulgare]